MFARLGKFGLELSEEKTKIVYCKQGNLPDQKEEAQRFTFLGHDFKPKTSKNRQTGKKFLSYLATASKAARVRMNQALIAYNIQKRTALSLEAIGTIINQQVRGWINYFERHGRNDLWHLFYWLNYRLMKWWKRKYRTGSIYVAIEQLKAEQKTNQKLFAHWQAGYTI